MNNPSADVSQRMLDDEGRRVESVDDPHHAADLEPRYDAVENLAVLAGLAAARLVDRDAAADLAENRRSNRVARLRHDRDRGELLDPVQDELEGAGRGRV